jgi:hypothetical protein
MSIKRLALGMIRTFVIAVYNAIGLKNYEQREIR